MSRLTSFYARYSSSQGTQCSSVSIKHTGCGHHTGRNEIAVSTDEAKRPQIKNLKTIEEQSELEALVSFMKQSEKAIADELAKPFYVPAFIEAEQETMQSNDEIIKGRMDRLKASEIHSEFEERYHVSEVVANCLQTVIFVGLVDEV